VISHFLVEAKQRVEYLPMTACWWMALLTACKCLADGRNQDGDKADTADDCSCGVLACLEGSSTQHALLDAQLACLELLGRGLDGQGLFSCSGGDGAIHSEFVLLSLRGDR
jgi:hypothetical protein